MESGHFGIVNGAVDGGCRNCRKVHSPNVRAVAAPEGRSVHHGCA